MNYWIILSKTWLKTWKILMIKSKNDICPWFSDDRHCRRLPTDNSSIATDIFCIFIHVSRYYVYFETHIHNMHTYKIYFYFHFPYFIHLKFYVHHHHLFVLESMCTGKHRKRKKNYLSSIFPVFISKCQSQCNIMCGCSFILLLYIFVFADRLFLSRIFNVWYVCDVVYWERKYNACNIDFFCVHVRLEKLCAEVVNWIKFVWLQKFIVVSSIVE